MKKPFEEEIILRVNRAELKLIARALGTMEKKNLAMKMLTFQQTGRISIMTYWDEIQGPQYWEAIISHLYDMKIGKAMFDLKKAERDGTEPERHDEIFGQNEHT